MMTKTARERQLIRSLLEPHPGRAMCDRRLYLHGGQQGAAGSPGSRIECRPEILLCPIVARLVFVDAL